MIILIIFFSLRNLHGFKPLMVLLISCLCWCNDIYGISTKLLWSSGIGAPAGVPALGSSLGHCRIPIWAAGSEIEDRYAVSHLVTFGSMLALVSSLDHHGGARILGYQKKKYIYIYGICIHTEILLELHKEVTM